MEAALEYPSKTIREQKSISQPKWQRITLLSILGYEGLGSLAGGLLLILSPDGKYMDMPVEMMNGVFSDFLIPGIILFGLGILNSIAFFSVLRRNSYDWIMADLAMGGLFIWFWVEITILRELHWLHIMWGLPVVLGVSLAVPLILFREKTITKALLLCGIVASLYYTALNIFIPMLWKDYSSMTQTVSELSAVEAPTRYLWFWTCMIYTVLFAAFGWGVMKSADGKYLLRIAGFLIVANSIIGLYWPPMHLRETLAEGGGTLSDTLHLVWAGLQILFMMLLMGFGAVALGKQFRFYTIVSFIVFIVAGIFIGMQSPNIQLNLPTPTIGFWERVNIGVFMLWVIIFAATLLRQSRSTGQVADSRIE